MSLSSWSSARLPKPRPSQGQGISVWKLSCRAKKKEFRIGVRNHRLTMSLMFQSVLIIEAIVEIEASFETHIISAIALKFFLVEKHFCLIRTLSLLLYFVNIEPM
jgi:hypothetical protein